MVHHLAVAAYSRVRMSSLYVFAQSIQKIAEAHQVSMDVVMYAFVLRHPAKIMPITGTMNLDRVKNAVDALKLELTYDEWYAILAASRGFDVP